MSEVVLERLTEAVVTYDLDLAKAAAAEAMESGVDPSVAIQALVAGVKEIGRGFQEGTLFLPDMMGAADAMQAAIPTIEAVIEKQGGERQRLGVVVLGTVAGDIHSIGKDLVATLLTSEGFDVHDLGVDVPADKFIAAATEYKPDIVAMSALLTTTAPEQQKVIAILDESGLKEKTKIMVGGGAITPEFADKIGADGYAPTAFGAVDVARELMGV